MGGNFDENHAELRKRCKEINFLRWDVMKQSDTKMLFVHFYFV